MLIVVEGIDGSGKTTLAKELSGYYKIPIYSMNKDIKYGKFLKEWASGITDVCIFDFMLQIPKVKVIIDRSLPSNYAYRKGIDNDILGIWYNFVNLLNIKMIYLFGASNFSRQEPKFSRYKEVCLEDNLEIIRRYDYLNNNMPGGSLLSINSLEKNVLEVFNIAKEFLGAN